MRRKQDKDEFVHGDPRVLRSWLILVGLYLLILLWLEPVIDFMLMQLPYDHSPESLNALNQKKAYVAAIAFGVLRSLPILMFLWLGMLVVQGQRLPPKGLKMPVSAKVIKGPKARMIGMGMTAIASVLLLRELTLLVSAQPLM